MKIKFLLAALMFSSYSIAADFSIQSPQIKPGATINNQQVFAGFGCSGENQSPELSWSKGPEGTKSYALMVYDPDAPTGSGWWHWVMFNIPANVHQLAINAGDPSKNIAPKGSVQSRTDFNKPGYGGPCPPKGDKAHRYNFTIYALNTDKLPLDENAPGAMVGYYVQSHKIAEAQLQGMYGR